MRKKRRLVTIFTVLAMTLTAMAVALSESPESLATAALEIIDGTTSDKELLDFATGLESIDGLSYENGSRGDGVRQVQSLLISGGYLAEGQADGIYGKKTTAAVEAFQQASGISVTGVADVATQFMLVEANSDFSAEGSCYASNAGRLATVIWPDKGFFVGMLSDYGDFYEGTYYYTSTGDCYAGEFEDNLRSGTGTAHFANGDVYVGEWANDAMSGEGTYWFGGEDSNEYYEGEWADNARNGQGTYHLPNGDEVTGTWASNSHISW